MPWLRVHRQGLVGQLALTSRCPEGGRLVQRQVRLLGLVFLIAVRKVRFPAGVAPDGKGSRSWTI